MRRREILLKGEVGTAVDTRLALDEETAVVFDSGENIGAVVAFVALLKPLDESQRPFDHLGKTDKTRIASDDLRASGLPSGQFPRILAFQRRDPGIGPQSRMLLVASDIDGDHLLGPGFEQDLDEAAGRRADIKAGLVPHIDVEQAQRLRQCVDLGA